MISTRGGTPMKVCALCPFGSTCQQLAWSGDGRTWENANGPLSLNIIMLFVPHFVIFCGNRLLFVTLPRMCRTIRRGYSNAAKDPIGLPLRHTLLFYTIMFGLPIMRTIMSLWRETTAHLTGGSLNISRDRQLFLGYRPMGPSRNSACLTMNRINSEQKQSKLSEYNMGS